MTEEETPKPKRRRNTPKAPLPEASSPLGPPIPPGTPITGVVLPPGLPSGVPPEIAAIFAGQQGRGQLTATTFSAELWAGQFPPPAVIEAYEKMRPGTFDDIVGMAKNKLDADLSNRSEHRKTQAQVITTGQILGAGVAVASVIGAVYCASINQPWVAGALVAVPVMSVALALVNGRRNPANAPPPPAANNPSTPATPSAPAPPT